MTRFVLTALLVLFTTTAYAQEPVTSESSEADPKVLLEGQDDTSSDEAEKETEPKEPVDTETRPAQQRRVEFKVL